MKLTLTSATAAAILAVTVAAAPVNNGPKHTYPQTVGPVWPINNHTDDLEDFPTVTSDLPIDTDWQINNHPEDLEDFPTIINDLPADDAHDTSSINVASHAERTARTAEHAMEISNRDVPGNLKLVPTIAPGIPTMEDTRDVTPEKSALHQSNPQAFGRNDHGPDVQMYGLENGSHAESQALSVPNYRPFGKGGHGPVVVHHNPDGSKIRFTAPHPQHGCPNGTVPVHNMWRYHCVSKILKEPYHPTGSLSSHTSPGRILVDRPSEDALNTKAAHHSTLDFQRCMNEDIDYQAFMHGINILEDAAFMQMDDGLKTSHEIPTSHSELWSAVENSFDQFYDGLSRAAEASKNLCMRETAGFGNVTLSLGKDKPQGTMGAEKERNNKGKREEMDQQKEYEKAYNELEAAWEELANATNNLLWGKNQNEAMM